MSDCIFHKGEEPCESCDAIYVSSQDVLTADSHMRGDVYYNCPVCSYTLNEKRHIAYMREYVGDMDSAVPDKNMKLILEELIKMDGEIISNEKVSYERMKEITSCPEDLEFSGGYVYKKSSIKKEKKEFDKLVKKYGHHGARLIMEY